MNAYTTVPSAEVVTSWRKAMLYAYKVWQADVNNADALRNYERLFASYQDAAARRYGWAI